MQLGSNYITLVSSNDYYIIITIIIIIIIKFNASFYINSLDSQPKDESGSQ